MFCWISRSTKANLLYISHAFGMREIELVKTMIRLDFAKSDIRRLEERVAILERAASIATHKEGA